MDDILLKVRSVSKKFETRKRLPGTIKENTGEFFALRDISFDLFKGNVVGIIGDNGAGKTTLLKVLSEILTPSSGTIEYFGQYHSILETGTGFHPDLSGMENVFLNASLLGMRRKEIKEKLDQIVAFSGIGEFIEMPVKHYSSGMYLRLAFSVAVFIDAEILLIDEVISVGDAEFRLKSLNKIRQKTQSGTSVILVSHNLNEIADLCTKCIWLHKGEIKEIGNPVQITQQYYKLAVMHHLKQINKEQKTIIGKKYTGFDGSATTAPENPLIPQMIWNDFEQAPGNDHIKIKSVAVNPGKPGQSTGLPASDAVVVCLEYWKQKPDEELELFMNLSDQLDNPVFVVGAHNRQIPAGSSGSFKTSVIIPGNLLNYGMYSAGFNFIKNHEVSVARFPHLIYFNIGPDENMAENYSRYYSPGPIRPVLQWNTEKS